MRLMKCGLVIVTACIVGLFAGVRADEERIPLDKVPKAVMKAVKKRFPDAELVGAAKETEGGKTSYEVMLKDGGKNIDVILTPQGAITVIEKEIVAADLPKVVKNAIDKKYPDATVKKIEELIKVTNGKEKLEFYEFLLQTADKKTIEVKVPPDGKIESKKSETGATSSDAVWRAHFAVGKGHLDADTQLTVTVLDETKMVDGVECRVVVENETAP
jgi:hypothetical protein